MLSTGVGIPGALMYGALVDQDINCRTVGRCSYGDIIDREVLDMVPREGDDEGTVTERRQRPSVPLIRDLGRAFLYARYNVDLSSQGLANLGFDATEPQQVQKMDNASLENIDLLFRIGQAAAAQVDIRHFGAFV